MDTLYIVWNDKYNVGIPTIDEQHRGIVTAINTLFEFIRQGQRTEQGLLQERKYPDLEAHIGLHKKLIDNTEHNKNLSPETVYRTNLPLG